MKIINYKNYTAGFSYKEDDGFLVGHIIGIKDIVGFHGETEREVTAAFREAVDHYIESCKALGKKPQEPKYYVPVSPQTLADVYAVAEEKETSVESWVSETLRRASRA